jgi:8-oxo-dGTP diphosphatase
MPDQPISDQPLLVVVAAALIDGEGQILVQKRPPGRPMADLWEFPGGKVESGETPEDALVRELWEELSIRVEPPALTPICFASEPLGPRHLVLLLYLIRQWEGVPVPVHASALQWLMPEMLADIAMPPADAPLVTQLVALLANEGTTR